MIAVRFLNCAFIVLLGISGRVAAAEAARAPLPPEFEASITRLMQDWSIPGAAVAVVRPAGPPTIVTFGLRQWDRPQRVDATTMFGIASITKTFVAAGIGLLVQEGKIGWDDPVVTHLPDFRVLDPWITSHVTIRDLLAHRSGVASYGDFFEEVPDLSEAELVRRLAPYGQSMPFRQGAEYNNYAYVVLATVIERVSGKPWGTFLQERLWRPLEMHDTYAHADDFVPRQYVLPTGDGWSDTVPTGLDAVGREVNVAAPHVRPEAFYSGKFVHDRHELDNTLGHFHRTAIDPSQSAFASIRDMARWAQVLLAPAQNEPASTVLSTETIGAMRRLGSVRKGDWPLNWQRIARDPLSGLHDVGFGLGLEIYSYREHMLFGHGGNELGYNALMVVDPSRELAVVALVNNAWRTWGAERAIVQTVLDWHYGAQAVDWSRHYLEEGARQHTENLAFIARLIDERPAGARSLPALSGYAGDYSNPLFGKLRIEERQGRLYATTGPTWEIELEHWGRDTFRGTVVSPLRLGAFARFTVDESRSASAVELEFVELWGTKFRFERARP
jgi:CubicO group peptidase (beta-lactamase class C family)